MFAKEYAKALYELALESNSVSEINDNFKILLDGINENEDYMKVLTYPKISNSKKKKSILSMFPHNKLYRLQQVRFHSWNTMMENVRSWVLTCNVKPFHF